MYAGKKQNSGWWVSVPAALLAMVALALPLQAGTTTLIGSGVRNGGFNDDTSATDERTFAETPYWTNIAGNQDASATRTNLDYDVTRNYVIDEDVSGKVAAQDTGHTITEGDFFEVRYVWRDAYNWDDGSAEVVVRLFTTDDDTIDGSATDFATLLSGTSTINSTYETASGSATATASEAGKQLFVAITTTNVDTANGWARLDNFTLTVTPEIRVAITNMPATSITTNSATLQANLAAVETNAHVHVYWWETAGGNTNDNSAAVGIWTNLASTNVSYSASGLTPGTAYAFTFQGTNTTTNVWASPDGSFTTLAEPVVTTGAGATAVDANAAELRGVLTAGVEADAAFVWGTADDGTGSTGDWQYVSDVMVASQDAAFTNTISGLYYGQQYYYRVYVTNAAGEGWSDVVAFTTVAPIGDWTPADTNAAAWYDASDAGTITANSGAVSEWRDKSDNGHTLTQADADARPISNTRTIEGRTALEFDGNDALTNGTAAVVSGNPDLMIASVCLFDRNVSGNDMIVTLGNGSGGETAAITGGSNGYSWRFFNGYESYGTVTTNAAAIQIGVRAADSDYGGSEMWLNGEELTRGNVGSETSVPNIQNGIWVCGKGGFVDGAIGEVLVLQDATGTTRVKIEGYLAHKWGLAGDLPEAHTYKGDAPSGDPLMLAITNTAAGQITVTTAELAGTLDASQSVFRVYAYVSTNENLTVAAWTNDADAVVFAGDLFTNAVDQAVAVSAGALTGGTLYYYRLMGSNVVTNVWAEETDSFTTLTPGQLSFEDETTDTITQESARLGAALQAPGVDVTVTAYWWITGASTTNDAVVGSWSDVALTNISYSTPNTLAADTEYNWRFHGVADTTNVWSSTSTFDTLISDAQKPVFTNAIGVAASGTVNLGWQDNASTETGYLLQRSTNGTDFVVVDTLAADTISYADSVPDPGVYYYRLAATNALNASGTDPALCETNVTLDPPPIELASLTQISGGSHFDISLYAGKASYDGLTSGVFGDGTIVDYRFFNDATRDSGGYVNGGLGRVGDITYGNTTSGGERDRGDVWTDSDPGSLTDGIPDFSSSADFGGTDETIASIRNVDGTVNITGLASGTVYILVGAYDNTVTVSLSMTGPLQNTLDVTSVFGTPNNRNLYVLEYPFINAGSLYTEISYNFTNAGDSASVRGRFMGVVLDALPGSWSPTIFRFR